MGTRIDNPLLLSELPSDIIRKIVPLAYDNATLDSMRLISPEWSSLVVHFINDNRQRLPAMDSIIFYFGKSGDKHELNSVTITGAVRRYETIDVDFTVIDSEATTAQYARIRRLIRRCSKIDLVEINAIYPNTLSTVRLCIENTSVRMLRITRLKAFVDMFRNPLLDIMRANSVLDFEVSVLQSINHNALRFFTVQALAFIKSIRIYGKLGGAHFQPRIVTYFGSPKNFWEHFVRDLNKSGTIDAQFFPDERGDPEESRLRFHFQSISSGI